MIRAEEQTSAAAERLAAEILAVVLQQADQTTAVRERQEEIVPAGREAEAWKSP